MVAIKSQQVLIPKSVYIGDQAELRCTFKISSDYLKSLTQNGSVELALSGFSDNLNYEDYEILNVQLYSAGVDYYVLSVNFVPWKTDYIKLPDYCINEELKLNLAFEKIEVKSLLREKNTTTARGNVGPLLLPGTIYKIYGTSVALIVLLIVLIRVFVKRKAIASFIKKRRILRKYKKLKKNIIKNLKTFVKKDCSCLNLREDSVKLQNLFRNYLTERFEKPFLQFSTVEIGNALDRMETKRFEALFNAVKTFFEKTDFFRYSFIEVEKSEPFKKDLFLQIKLLIEQLESIQEV